MTAEERMATKPWTIPPRVVACYKCGEPNHTRDKCLLRDDHPKVKKHQEKVVKRRIAKLKKLTEIQNRITGEDLAQTEDI